MRKYRKAVTVAGTLAAAGVIAVFGGTSAASAATTTTYTLDSPENVAANPTPGMSTHTDYKWIPDVNGSGPTLWTLEDAAPNTHTKFPVKGVLVSYHRDGTKTTQAVDTINTTQAVDTPVIAPTFQVDAGTCSVTVPLTPGIDTYLYGVNGHPETEAITSDVTVTGSLDGTPDTAPQFWIGFKAKPGYSIQNAGTTHIDFYNGDNIRDC